MEPRPPPSPAGAVIGSAWPPQARIEQEREDRTAPRCGRPRRLSRRQRSWRSTSPWFKASARSADWCNREENQRCTRAQHGAMVRWKLEARMRVACIGECMVELTLPREDGADGRVGFAGDTLNVAVYLKRSAPEIEVAYVTALGSDPLSARMLGFFAREGLDTGLVERRADRVPGLYAISLDERGERSFTYWRDSSAARTLFLPPADVTPERLADFDLVYLSGITLAILAPEARRSLAGLSRRLPAGRRAGGVRFELPPAALDRRGDGPARDRRALGAHRRRASVGRRRDGAARRRRCGCGAGAPRRRRRSPRRAQARPRGPAAARAGRCAPRLPAGGAGRRHHRRGRQLQRRLPCGDDARVGEADCLAAGHATAAEVVGHPGAIIPRATPEAIG